MVSFSPATESLVSTSSSLLGSFWRRFSKASLNLFMRCLSLAFSVFLLYLLSLFPLAWLLAPCCPLPPPCSWLSVCSRLATELWRRLRDLCGSCEATAEDITVITGERERERGDTRLHSAVVNTRLTAPTCAAVTRAARTAHSWHQHIGKPQP